MVDGFFVQEPNVNQNINPNQPVNVNPTPIGAPGVSGAPIASPVNPAFNPGVAAASLNASMGPQGSFVPGGSAVGLPPSSYPVPGSSAVNPGMATLSPTQNPVSGPGPDQSQFIPQIPQALVNDRIYGKEVGSLDFGQQRPRWPMNKFKGVMGKTQRIGVLSLEKGDWFALPEHFISTARTYVYCFEGSCCTHGSPKTMYVIPVVTYLDLDSQGNVTSDRVAYEFLSLSEKKYKDLVAISKWAPLLEIDLFVTCENDQFQDIKFNIVGANGAATKAVWKMNPQFQQVVWNDFQRVKVCMLQANARVLGNTKQEAEAAFQNLLSQPPQGGPGGQGMTGGGGSRPPTSAFNPTQWSR
jgi:hypothetical protein